MHIPFFNIFYSTTFSILALVLVGLSLITPGDHIRQSLKRSRLLDIFLLAGIYILTFLVCAFVYAVRLFAVRSLLASIPKEWSPFQKGHVEEKVRRMVERSLKRSVCIARETRPRDLGGEAGVKRTWEELRRLHDVKKPKPTPQDREVEEKAPPWGDVSHAGWSSPSSTDLPDLQFMSVILELPNLIEAKAVSLIVPIVGLEDDQLQDTTTPTASETNPQDAPPTLPDPVAVEILQRSSHMDMRDYLTHLSTLNLISSSEIMMQFLVLYETARFSTCELTEPSFRILMDLFAALLRGMETLDEEIFAEAYAAATANEASTEGISLYSTSSRSSSSTRSFITSGDVAPALTFARQSSMHHPGNVDGEHDPDGSVASIHTSSTVEHHHLAEPSSRPPLNSYITNSSYRSARAAHDPTRTPSPASLNSDDDDEPNSVPDDAPSHVSSDDLTSRASTDLGSVIRLSEEGGRILDLPLE